MKSKFKIQSLIGLTVIIFFITQVHAACVIEERWQLWDWIEYTDLIDVEFNNQDTYFINSHDVQVQINGLGTWVYPELQDSKVYTDPNITSEIVRGVSGAYQNPRVIAISFSEEIEIGDLELSLEAENKNTGKSIEKQLYVNTSLEKRESGYYLPEDAKPAYMWINNGLENISINKRVKQLLIVFADNSEDAEYQLNYLQILSYKAYRWTGEYVDYNTGFGYTRTETCLDSGEFSPNGTLWTNGAATTFSPSVKNTSIYAPIETEGLVLKDICREDNVTVGSKPGCLVDNSAPSGLGNTAIHGLADTITEWKIHYTQDAYQYYYSVLSNTTSDNEYIFKDSKEHTGVTYFAYPVHWSFDPNEENPIYTQNSSGVVERVVSNDAGGWCKHATGQDKAPCYKYAGHTLNERTNAWDVQLNTYNNVYNNADQVVYQTEYTLINILEPDSNKSLETIEGNQAFTYEFNEHGVWQVDAEITGVNGLSETVSSELFHIDLEKPYLIADQPQGVWTNQDIYLTLQAVDNHSQIDHWSYKVSTDQGESWMEHSKTLTTSFINHTFKNEGIYLIEAELTDKAGNQNTQRVGQFMIDKTPPVSTNKNPIILTDQTGKEIRNGQWINGETEIYLQLQDLYDQPYIVYQGEINEVQCSRVSEGWAKVYSAANGDDDATIHKLKADGNHCWSVNVGNLKDGHLLKDGEYQIEIYASDLAGNESLISNTMVKIDYTPPEINAVIEPEGWTNQDVTVKFDVADRQSGIASFEDEHGNELSDEIVISKNQTLKVIGVDKAGNKTEKEIPVTNIDKVKPEMRLNPKMKDWTNQSVFVNLSPQDLDPDDDYSVSGIKQWQYALSLDDGKTYGAWSENYDDRYGNYQEYWTDWTTQTFEALGLDNHTLLNTEKKIEWQKCTANWSPWSTMENTEAPLEDRRQKQESTTLSGIQSSVGELKRIDDEHYTLELPFGTKQVELSAVSENPDLIISGVVSGIGSATRIIHLTDFSEELHIETKAPLSGIEHQYIITTIIENQRTVYGTRSKYNASSQLTDSSDRGQLAGKSGTIWMADFNFDRPVTLDNATISAYQSGSDWGNMTRGDITLYYKTRSNNTWQYLTRFTQGGGGGVWQGSLTEVTAISLYYTTKGSKNYYGYIDVMDLSYHYQDNYTDFSQMPEITPPQTNTHQSLVATEKQTLYSYKIWSCLDWTDQKQTAKNEMEKVTDRQVFRYQYYTGGKVIELSDTGIYRIKTKTNDHAGNEDISVSDVYKIDKVIPYAEISAKTTATKYDSAYIEPQDEHSGVQLWNYAISSDGGESWFYESGDLTEPSALFQLEPRQSYLIKVWIKDHAGNESEEIKKFVASVKAPEIKAHDRWFFVGTEVTKEEMMNDVSAKDFDGLDITNRIHIVNFEDLDTSEVGITEIHYEVTDDNGLISQKTVLVHVIDQNGLIQTQEEQIRFISGVYLDTLQADSKWRSDGLKQQLTESIHREQPLEIYVFDEVDFDRIKQQNKELGFNPHAYQKFYEEFGNNKR